MLDNNFDVWVFCWWNRTKAAKLIAFVCCELSRFLLKIEKENKIKLIWIEIIGEFEFGLKSVPYVKFFLFFYSCFVWPEGICMQFYAKTFERNLYWGRRCAFDACKMWRTRALGMARSHQCLNLRRWNSLFDLLHVHILRNTHSTRFKIASVVSQIFDIFYAVVIPSPPPPPSSTSTS